MNISTINGIRVIIPSEGMFLCKESSLTISEKVFLGINDTEFGWEEITEERKQELESLWGYSSNSENIATDDDYISALEDLGVKFNG